MGFLDFLKGILPDINLINIDNRKYDNRRIEINSDSIVFGDKRIKGSKKVDEIIEKISEYKDEESLPSQIIHKNLDKSYNEYEEISQKESIKKLSSVLPEEDVECILMARRVVLAYEKKNVDLGKELHKQLCEKYPEKGNKVYNLMGGGYFDEMIIPFIDVYQSQYGEEYVQKYRQFYYDLIKFFPLAIFVGNFTKKDQIISMINERLVLSVPFIRIHAIGDVNIKKVDEVIEEHNFNEKTSIQDNRFTTSSGIKAQILEIRISKKD